MKNISAKEQREIFENLGNEIAKGITKSITETQEYNDKLLEEFEKHFKSCLKNSKNKQKIYLISSEKARPEQIHFLKTMQEYGAITGIARSVEEAREIIKKG